MIKNLSISPMGYYLAGLMGQYEHSTRIPSANQMSPKYTNEFSMWINERKNIGKDYTCFLDYNGFRFANSNCAEIGKGRYDTISRPLDNIIITSYTSINDINPNRIIDGGFVVLEGKPLIVKSDKFGKYYREVPNEIVNTYFTQNPLHIGLVSGWEDLNNSGDASIIVGVYGKTYDRDKTEKIDDLMRFADKLTPGTYTKEYATDKDNYFFVVGTHQKEKVIEKVKTR